MINEFGSMNIKTTLVDKLNNYIMVTYGIITSSHSHFILEIKIRNMQSK
jgi:hypothetical protein